MNVISNRLLFTFIILANADSAWKSVAAAPATSPVNSIRILIISGGGNHDDWRSTTPFLRRILSDTGRFDVRTCESPAGLTARTLSDFDAIVSDYAGPPLGADSEEALVKFVESGKGLVLTQAALRWLVSRDAPAPRLAAIVKASAAELPRDKQPASAGFLDVRFLRLDHPIARGMNGEFKAADALDQRFALAPEVEVIATCAKDEPVLFASTFGKGRIFCTALGHDVSAMHSTEFITTFARGVQWAASGDVTLPADLGRPHPHADAVRALLITGGHDHVAEFYGIFDGYRDLAPIAVGASGTAFQKDLRENYDVLITYDFSRDLDETGRKNLRDFLESGKGLVVLHHALLSYQGWPWWYEEVVGGRYRLAGDGKNPSSTYKLDQQMFITPRRHPITAGIAPFQITDETYKRMWISPKVTPLLTTDNPSSDPTIAWVSPYEKSKVVYVQLGHGHGSFDHPSFREIVHNAILWTAGRIK
jgi:type 1 glutamine amidotransferase